MITRSE